LKEHPQTSDIPVMFLTALLSKGEEEEHGHLIGGSVIFAKPFDAEVLLTQVKQLLQKKEAEIKNVSDRYVSARKGK